jgi:nickel transport protein
MNLFFLNPHVFYARCGKALIRMIGFISGIMLVICALPNLADAHKVNIFAYAQNGKVHAEGYFADGSKCRNSLISVIDEKTGRKLLEGHTDDSGKFTFDIPYVTSLKLLLQAGPGHQNEYILAEDEIREAVPVPAGTTGQGDEQRKKAAPAPKQLKSVHSHTPDDPESVAYHDLESMVGKVVDSRLEPVMRILLRLQEQSEKPGLIEIIGGIGYIIGIIGIIGYFKGRAARRNKPSP